MVRIKHQITLLFYRHAYHSVSTPPTYPPKNATDLKLPVATSSFPSSDAVVIHPGAMLAMLDLLASVGSVTQPEVSMDVSSSPSIRSGLACVWLRDQGSGPRKMGRVMCRYLSR